MFGRILKATRASRCVQSRPERQCSPLCREISEFCNREYYDMTRHYGQSEQSDSVHRSDQRSKREGLSFGSSIQYVCKPDSLIGGNGKYIVHIDPIVLARCGLIRSICYEFQYMPSEGSVMFEKQIDGRYALNKNVKLVFRANFSPACLSIQVTTTAYPTHIIIQRKSNRQSFFVILFILFFLLLAIDFLEPITRFHVSYANLERRRGVFRAVTGRLLQKTKATSACHSPEAA
ncbi:Protein CBG23635 [Caenorhabditis briggsae]|uniref:Protein CBG23635 n=1 Tax=Caenorhabditis briggsae TaxID=6238 RepID=A8WIZ5_CAEBR|nr:Protein CBG23635 [Caenorhabditis briggsae]CAP20440.1 Protein CBG23635 [Caenorhabditis briggsae]